MDKIETAVKAQRENAQMNADIASRTLKKRNTKEADAYASGVTIGQSQAAMVYQPKLDALLEACEAALHALESYPPSPRHARATIGQVRAAIDKARQSA